MNSDTSSDLNINYLNKFGDEIKQEEPKKESDTDYYLNMLANVNKTVQESEKSSSLNLSDMKDSDKSTSSINSSSSRQTTVSSKPKYETVDMNTSFTKKTSNHNSKNRGDRTEHRYSSEYDRTVTHSPVKLTPQEIRMKKIELLRKLCELKQKGYKLSKEYDFNSTMEDMEYEYDLLKSFADKRNGIKLYKNILLNVCSVTEFINDKYDPFSFQLSGWSEHMSVEVDSYDDVLEELYEKYKGKGSTMPPELKLLLLVLASASAFHFSKAHLSNIPGLDKVLEKNPDLISNLINGKKQSSNFMTQQDINLEQQRKELQERERRFKEQQREKRQTSQYVPKSNEMHQQRQQPVNVNPSESVESYQNAHYPVDTNSQTSIINNAPSIRAPDSVNEILNRLHAREQQSVTDTQEETSANNDRIVSDTTLSESKRRGRKKKSLMKIT